MASVSSLLLILGICDTDKILCPASLRGLSFSSVSQAISVSDEDDDGDDDEVDGDDEEDLDSDEEVEEEEDEEVEALSTLLSAEYVRIFFGFNGWVSAEFPAPL